ncbi:MAG: hypothetical protein IJR97_05215 [Clostridia bacterium]|nr:hypothetical protein [Clostridia bacterium]
MKTDYYKQPWLLVPNKIRSAGGRETDRFRGSPDPKDTPSGAEAWIGSVTRANGATAEHPDLGCSEVILPDGEKRYLYRVIGDAPAEVLGEKHCARHGPQLGVLVKLLDAKNKFPLQCHPSREKAEKLWNSPRGKTECWHVLAVRDDVPVPPFIWLGFKPGITPEKFEEAYRTGSLKAAEDLCHRFTVHPGETWFVPSGMPHALGPGCFVLEVQEPSDLTAVPIPQEALIAFRKRANPRGVFEPVDPALYEKRMLGSFDYEGIEADRIAALCRVRPRTLREGPWGTEELLIGGEQTPYFSCSIMKVKGCAPVRNDDDIAVGVVTEGEGRLLTGFGPLPVKRGSEVFFPARAKEVYLEGDAVMILCRPAGS